MKSFQRFCLTLSVSTNNSKYLDFFRTGPSQIAMIRSTSFYITRFRNPRTRSYGYVKYKISNPSRKRRETDTQFKVSKQNSILDLIDIDTYRILWKAVKPTNQSFFLSRILDLWCQWSKGSEGRRLTISKALAAGS